MRLKLFIILLSLFALPLAAQNSSVSGVVVDADSGNPVAGATIILSGGGSAITGPNGDFLLSSLKEGDETLTVIAYGYLDIVKNLAIPAKGNTDLGRMRMAVDKSMATSSDIAVLDETQIEDEEGNDQSIGVLSGASDDIYYSAASYDFSTTRFRIRGYEQEYQQMYINGVQITDAIRGRFNYSSFGGMNQAFKNRSVSVGLNPASFSLGGIGGATNVNTLAANYAPGFRANLSYTNGAYTTRGMITYSTGLNDKGWAFTLSAIGRYSKEGITEGTFYHSAGLFMSLQKVFNDNHSLNLTLYGAPTQRATSSATYEEAYVLADSYMYNPNWGWQDGKKRSSKIVESFDPTAILNWIWNVKSGTQLNTGAAFRYSLYSSSALNWRRAADPRADYYRYLPSYYSDKQEEFDRYTELWRNSESMRQINWDQLYYTNQTTPDVTDNGKRSTYILENRHSNQMSFALNSVLNHRLNEHMTLQAGASFNYTRATYYKTLRDALGGDYWLDIDTYAERDFPDNESMLYNDMDNPMAVIHKGDKFGYNYDINSIIASAWLQNIVNLDHWDFNYGLNLSFTQFQRDGKMRNGRSPQNSKGKGERHQFDNAMAKAGITYKVNGHHFFTLNANYGSRAPLADNVYIAPRIKDDAAADIRNERVLSGDLSYSFNYSRFRGTLTGFWTNTYNGTDRSSFYDDNYSTFTNYVLTGVNKTYKGIEIGLAYKITPDLSVSFAGTFSRYQYKNRPKGTRSFENGVRADTTQTVYLKNFYVGGTPQTAGSLSINYNAPHMWFLELNGTWTGDAYIELSPIRHEYMPGLAAYCENKEAYEAKVREITNQEKLRDAFTLNLSIGKVFYFGSKMLNFNLSINNLLNKRNIQTGGYQQSRFDYTDYNVGKYPNRYYYAQGIRIYANVGFRF